MILLDTNVISEFMKARPDPNVVAWVDAQPGRVLVICSISVAEILYGLARMPDGKRKSGMLEIAKAIIEEDFAGQVLSFDTDAAVHYAALAAMNAAKGRSVGMADAQIAAIARLHEATIATRNVRDFEAFGVPLVNPWEN
ncbi:type II toxin-antitoxin system VapC family toxin [Pseudomonas sp. BN417]|uniref:type II toxin-antitoxin system VapC family toxin n=1 Tax=Pseudomonas sp. BN417 TaxID=2567890 RepID=UPI00245403CD|nr:type II toxin-antitoxin system VapC family toxin [Pseudomonas sp. BN417]MDH4553787.1 type II toxin-antitoxin system VapC family toxin [Pseudomonas sp. BN417]